MVDEEYKDRFHNYYKKIYENIMEYVNSLDRSELAETVEKFENGYQELLETFEWKTLRFHSHLHEIKTYKFLKEIYGDTFTKRSDEKKGPDFLVNNHIHIECVVSTFGSLDDPKTHEVSEIPNGVIDVQPVKEFVMSRITASIREKKQKYQNYLGDVIISNQPYVIFVNVSMLEQRFHFGNNLRELLYIIMDIGYEIMYWNKTTLNYSHSDYARDNVLKTRNGSQIPIGLFLGEAYNNISAIIFTNAQFGDFYDDENTAIFVNPEADNPINLDRLKGYTVYNKIREEVDGYIYGI